jgi:hypothetical protein
MKALQLMGVTGAFTFVDDGSPAKPGKKKKQKKKLKSP